MIRFNHYLDVTPTGQASPPLARPADILEVLGLR